MHEIYSYGINKRIYAIDVTIVVIITAIIANYIFKVLITRIKKSSFYTIQS
jgi:hypothetical protein